MSVPLKNVFCKRSIFTNSIKKQFCRENKAPKPEVTHSNRKPNQDSPIKIHRRPSTTSLDFKWRSSENVMLVNTVFENVISQSIPDAQFRCTKELQKSSSVQSSLNENKTTNNYKSEENLYFYKFDNVLEDESGLKHFKKFLSEEFSSENINFWVAVDKFSKITDKKLMASEARKIFFNYMDAQTNTPVNLECEIVDKARKQLNEPTIDMFNVAKNHIYYLMKNDSYNRFIISRHFNLWQKSLSTLCLKPSSSTSSLAKKGKSIIPNILKTKNRLSKGDSSRKSSSQTIDSDSSVLLPATSSCKITLAYDVVSIHNESITSNKKLIQVLKKYDKKLLEFDHVAFDEGDNRIIHFTESMTNLCGARICVEKATLMRIGFVQDNLYEIFWFVLKCRSSICLSAAIDPVMKRLQFQIDKYCAVKESNPKVKLEWTTPVNKLHNSALLLIEHHIFHKTKVFPNALRDGLEALWNRIIKNTTFQMSLPFDSDNILDSRSEFFHRFDIKTRQIGYIISNFEDDNVACLINREIGNSFDDQRGIFTEDQFSMPHFLQVPIRPASVESSSDISRQHSNITNFESDLSFSEFDESSDPSPEKYELISDLE